MTKPADRLSFVRGEFRALGRSATPEACQALVDSIGSDLRELASAVSQLVADVEGTIDEAVVGAVLHGPGRGVQLHRGRPCGGGAGCRGAGGVAVVAVDRGRARSDHQCVGAGRAGYREAFLRAGRAAADLARELGMPPWKIDRVRQQMRGWTPDGVAVALRAVRRLTRGSRAAGTIRSTRWRRRSWPSPGGEVPPGLVAGRVFRPRRPCAIPRAPGGLTRLLRADAQFPAPLGGLASAPPPLTPPALT